MKRKIEYTSDFNKKQKLTENMLQFLPKDNFMLILSFLIDDGLIFHYNCKTISSLTEVSKNFRIGISDYINYIIVPMVDFDEDIVSFKDVNLLKCKTIQVYNINSLVYLNETGIKCKNIQFFTTLSLNYLINNELKDINIKKDQSIFKDENASDEMKIEALSSVFLFKTTMPTRKKPAETLKISKIQIKKCITEIVGSLSNVTMLLGTSDRKRWGYNKLFKSVIENTHDDGNMDFKKFKYVHLEEFSPHKIFSSVVSLDNSLEKSKNIDNLTFLWAGRFEIGGIHRIIYIYCMIKNMEITEIIPIFVEPKIFKEVKGRGKAKKNREIITNTEQIKLMNINTRHKNLMKAIFDK